MEVTDGSELCFSQLNNSCRKPPLPELDAVLAYTVLPFISVLTAALNLLVIISISYFRQLHSPTNLLTLSLAVSDLLVGLLLMPVEILFTEACWFLGDLTCALYYIVNFTITSSSVGNVVLISADRYVAICDPLHYATRVTLDRTKICVCLCWTCSVLYNSVILKDFLLSPHDSLNSCFGQCVVALNYITGIADCVFTFILPITVVIVLYMRVFVVAVSQARAMRSHIAAVPRRHSLTNKTSEVKAARTLGVVVLVFLICFCPYYSSSLVGKHTDDSSSYLPSVVWLLYFNSCLNPVIYAFFYPWFRRSIKIIVTLEILLPDSCYAKIL